MHTTQCYKLELRIHCHKEITNRMAQSGLLNIVAIGAHIHDAEVMAGAVLANYTRNGHSATIIHVTPGEKGHPGVSPEVYEKTKRQEAAESAEVLGAEVVFLPYKDAELPLTNRTINSLASLLRQMQPDCVLTHWRGSFHPDHFKTHCLAVEAVRKSMDFSFDDGQEVCGNYPVLFCENWEDKTGFVPDILVDISDSYEIWLNAMMKHGLFRGEVSPFNYRAYYEGLIVERGALAKTGRAVALMRSPFSSTAGDLPAVMKGV